MRLQAGINQCLNPEITAREADHTLNRILQTIRDDPELFDILWLHNALVAIQDEVALEECARLAQFRQRIV